MEAVIKKHLQSQDSLTPYLALYQGEKAVFSEQHPKLQGDDWDTDRGKYLITFRLERKRDPGRVGRSILFAEIEEAAQDESESLYLLRNALKECLDGYIFNSEKEIFAAGWHRDEIFPEQGGRRMMFRLTRFAKPVCLEGFPEKILRQWSSAYLETRWGNPVFQIGEEGLSEAFLPTALSPAVYWRTLHWGKCDFAKDSHAAQWRRVTLRGHIIAPEESSAASELALLIENTLEKQARLEWEDGVILIGEKSRVNLDADPVRTGQITIDAVYPVTGEKAESEKLRNAVFSMR